MRIHSSDINIGNKELDTMLSELTRFENRMPVTAPNSLDQLDAQLKLYSDEKIDVWYAPLGDRVPNPKIWILGITPGWAQMEIAYKNAAVQMAAGASPSEAAASRKPSVAFAGPMRKNLVSMLDELGVAKAMGFNTSADLFDTELLRTGSVLKYPVFKDGKNYSGAGPKPLKHPALKSMIDNILADELRSVDECLIVPLGTAVDEVLNYFVQSDKIDPNRILTGFPHPSGGNGSRVRSFNKRKEKLAKKVDNWFSSVFASV